MTRFGFVWSVALVGSLSLFGSGCGSIHVVEEAQRGGTVALHGPEGSAREKAEEYIRKRCPKGFEIVEEGDAMRADGDGREWRIVYACKGEKGRTAVLAF